MFFCNTLWFSENTSMYNLKAFILIFLSPFFLWVFRHLFLPFLNYNSLLSLLLRHPAGQLWGEHACRMINPFAFQRSVLLGPWPLPRKVTLWPPAPGSKGTASRLKVSPDLRSRGSHKVNYVVWLGKVDFYVRPNFRNNLWSGQLALFISSFPPQSEEIKQTWIWSVKGKVLWLPVLAAPTPIPWLDTWLHSRHWVWSSAWRIPA